VDILTATEILILLRTLADLMRDLEAIRETFIRHQRAVAKRQFVVVPRTDVQLKS